MDRSQEGVVEKLKSAQELKSEGNVHFVKKNYKEAIRCYHRALLYIKGVDGDGAKIPMSPIEELRIDPAMLDENKKLKIDCYNNLAACFLQSSAPNYLKVITYAKMVVELSPENVKAHSRLAQALYKDGDLDGAIESCDKVLKYQGTPDSKIEKLKVTCKNELAKKSVKHKEMYAKMMRS